MSNQQYEEGYTVIYTTPDGPKHAWKSISLTVWLTIYPNTMGNRYGFMQGMKKFHEIMTSKKIHKYHIVSVQCHTIKDEVAMPEYPAILPVPTSLVPLVTLKDVERLEDVVVPASKTFKEDQQSI